jgi:hypothetical protein
MIADAKSNAPINGFKAVLSEQSTWGKRGENGAFPATHTHHQMLVQASGTGRVVLSQTNAQLLREYLELFNQEVDL